LIGRLTADITLNQLDSGVVVGKSSIAVSNRPAKDGENSTSFFNFVVWGKTAENCAKYIKKGSKIAIDGCLDQRSWTALDGSKKSLVEIIAERIEFLDSKKDNTDIDF